MKIPLCLHNPFNKTNISDFNQIKYNFKIKRLINNKNFKKKNFDIVIMAAGKNSRININYPKALIKLKYPNNKITIIENLINILEISQIKINKINIVVRKEYEKNFLKIKRNFSKVNIISLNEDQITGTARCLINVEQNIKSDDFILLWGDIALISRRVINCIALLHSKYNSLMSFATCIKKNPYVSIKRNANGEIVKVKHNKQVIIKDFLSEQDSSFFICKKKIFKHLINFESKFSPKEECDFIKFLPYINKFNKLISPPFAKNFEVEGINYKKDLNFLKNKLNKLKYTDYVKNYLSPYDN